MSQNEEDETEEEEALETKTDPQEVVQIGEDTRLVLHDFEHAKQTSQFDQLAEFTNLGDTKELCEAADVEDEVDG